MDKFILLFPHGAVDRTNRCTPDDRQPLSGKGQKDTVEVASRLAGVIEDWSGGGEPVMRIGAMWHGTYDHVAESATIFETMLKKLVGVAVECDEKPALNPSEFGPYRSSHHHVVLVEELTQQLVGFEKSQKPENAILVVGHQPLLGWMAHHLLGKPTPFGGGELVCLREVDARQWGVLERRRWSLLWSIAPRKYDNVEPVREKIKSKMDLAKLLGAFIAAVFGLVYGQSLEKDLSTNL